MSSTEPFPRDVSCYNLCSNKLTAANVPQTYLSGKLFNLLPEAEESMDVDAAPAGETEGSASSSTTPASAPKKYTPPVDPNSNTLIPEAVMYIRLLLILAAIDAGQIAEAGEFALETTNMVQKANRRTMDQIAAKVYFYLARAYDVQEKLAELRP